MVGQAVLSLNKALFATSAPEDPRTRRAAEAGLMVHLAGTWDCDAAAVAKGAVA